MNTRYWSALAVTTALLLSNAQAQVVKLEFEGHVGSSYDYAGNLTGSQGHDVVNGRSILVQVAWESDAGAFDGFNFSGPHSWLTTRVLLDGTLLTHDVSAYFHPCRSANPIDGDRPITSMPIRQ